MKKITYVIAFNYRASSDTTNCQETTVTMRQPVKIRRHAASAGAMKQSGSQRGYSKAISEHKKWV